MAEKIYSIKIKEAFNEKCGCPVCTIRNQLEADEIQRILGAAMMEPDIRKETNKKGFCKTHLERLLTSGNKLPLALMLNTHLAELDGKLFKGGSKKAAGAYADARKSCYLCSRVATFMTRVADNICYLYASEESFRSLLAQQEFFCKTHSAKLLEMGEKTLGKKDRAAFADEVTACNKKYIQTLQEDLDWFCKKFDYRYEKEDWKNAKDSIERTVKYLS